MEHPAQRAEKRRSSSELMYDDEDCGSDENVSNGGDGKMVKVMEQDKKMRREIANSNERRRMQSINAGFDSLKLLLPHHDGEKLSKAAVLQQTSEYISTLESEKTRLITQNEQLKRMLSEMSRENDQQISPPPKRKKRDTESSDEGIAGMSASETEETQNIDEMRRELVTMRVQLERERRLRLVLEERNRDIEAKLYPHQVVEAAKPQQQPQHIYQEPKNVEEPMLRKEPVPTIPAPVTLQPVPQAVAPQVLLTQHQQPQLEAPMAAPAPLPVVVAVKNEVNPAPMMTSIPQPRAHIPMNPTASSMSRRNLETIVEAIRHLEGDSVLFDSFKKPESRDIPHSEGESEKESSMYSDEEVKSEGSGRDSPPLFKPHHTTAMTTTVHVRQEAIPMNTVQISNEMPQYASSDRYPIATQLLHCPSTLQQNYNHRPAVIVQNLS